MDCKLHLISPDNLKKNIRSQKPNQNIEDKYLTFPFSFKLYLKIKKQSPINHYWIIPLKLKQTS
ncbi:hypothetical protein OO7_07664 [Providencia sneebia DSM 19967]|uniref:Uncharacterized protein n=1 Tax=Providencia sneebia DSM 19967 TaxID=1141660 RepID=K8WQZ3_9GAMM|nr:hypothetical protein OO7_07664 [Providencia sneebia DSM 19967]